MVVSFPDGSVALVGPASAVTKSRGSDAQAFAENYMFGAGETIWPQAGLLKQEHPSAALESNTIDGKEVRIGGDELGLQPCRLCDPCVTQS